MEKKKKIIVDILYDPRENPLVEVYLIDDYIAIRDKALWKANQRMRMLLTEMRQIIRYVGFDPDVVLKVKYIKKLGEPHYIPVVYINNVLFSTVYKFDAEKFYKILKEMKKLRDSYLAKQYRDIDKGYIIYPDEQYIHLRNPLHLNKMVHSSQFSVARQLNMPSYSVDPYEELPVTRWLVEGLRRQGVPITNIGVVPEVRYKVLVTPERKPIEL